MKDTTTSAVSKAAYTAGGDHSGVSGRPPAQGTSPLGFPRVHPHLLASSADLPARVDDANVEARPPVDGVQGVFRGSLGEAVVVGV